MNKVILIGRLTADPELHTTQSGTQTCSFTVAVDRNNGKDKEKTADFIRCTAFGSRGEFVGKYFMKGKQIALTGNIRTGSYEKDGVKHFTTDVWVDEVEFVGSKGESGQQTAQSAPATPAAETTTEDDLPF